MLELALGAFGALALAYILLGVRLRKLQLLALDTEPEWQRLVPGPLLGPLATLWKRQSAAYLSRIEQAQLRVQELERKLQSELAAQQTLQRQLQTKDRFFSLIAHDLKAPFQALKGYSALLLDFRSSADDGERQRMTEKIALAADEAQNLLDKLLRWTLLQQGVLQAKPEAFCLRDCIVEVVELLLVPARVKGVTLEISVAPDLWIYADRAMIATILRNLVSNALKFSHPQDGRVLVKAKEHEESVELWVIDHGVGMQSETLEKMRWKEPLTSELGTDKETGTGLGLRLCHQFALLHKTQLLIESLPGQGTRIMSQWSRAKPQNRAAGAHHDGLQRLLLIDDDLDNHDLLKIFLRDVPLEIDFAEDGLRGVEQFAQKAYDIVLMDLHMPELNGVEATRRLRALEQQLGRPRSVVIAFSSSLLQDDIDAAIHAGCDAYLLKPVQKKNLLQTLQRYVKA